MNKVILMGRLTRDPDVRYSQGENSMAIARYSLAVDRRFNRGNDDNNTDLSILLHSVRPVNLLRNTYTRERRF